MPQVNPLQSISDFGYKNPSQGSTFTNGRKFFFYAVVASASVILGVAIARLPVLLVFGGLVGLASAVAILLKPFWGLMIYTIIFTLRLGEVYPILGALHLERIVGVLTVAGLFLHQHQEAGSIRFDASRQTKRLLLFTLVAGLSVPLAFWRQLAMNGFVEILKVVAFYVMILHLVDTRAKLRHFIFLFCLTVLWLSANSLLSYFRGNAAFAQGIDRATGTTSVGGNANALGTTMASTLPLFFFLTISSRVHKGKRVLLAIGTLALLITLAITGSRASLLGFLGGLVYLWKRSRRRILFGFVGVALICAGFFLLPEQYRERYSTITSSSIDASSHARLVTWMAGWRLFVEHPVVGVGIQCFAEANGAANGSWLSSHSLYLQVLAELGLAGALVFILFFSEMLQLNRRARRSLQDADWSSEVLVLDALFTGFVVLLVSGIFGHSLLRTTWYIFAAIDLVIWRLWWQEQQLEAAPT